MDVISNPTFLGVLTVLSLLFGILGVITAMRERQSRANLENILRSSLMTILHRISIHNCSHENIYYVLNHRDGPELDGFLWRKKQFLDDIYHFTVQHFVSSVPRFRYEDIRGLVENHIVTTSWEECRPCNGRP